jgi:hypothetical protein
LRSLSILAVLLIGCQQAQVTHVVVVWLKDPGNEQQREKLIDLSKSFKAIPGVVNVSAGRTLPSTRPAVETTYDIAIVMKFKDRQALKDYATHPMHVEATEKFVKPLVERFVIYDFEE